MQKYHVYTNEPIISPVSASSLAEWLRGECDDPLYRGILITATSAVINFIKRDLIARKWTLTYQDWPTIGADNCGNLSPSIQAIQCRIDLPYANLLSVELVKSCGDTLTTDDYTVLNQLPAQLSFDAFTISTTDDPALYVEYTAGFGSTAGHVPEEIKQAILMIAGYTYLHRGCSADDALKSSGAYSLLVPYAVNAGIVF